MNEAIALGFCALVGAPLLYLHHLYIRSVLEFERSQYDDSDCEPGFTNYPGPM